MMGRVDAKSADDINELKEPIEKLRNIQKNINNQPIKVEFLLDTEGNFLPVQFNFIKPVCMSNESNADYVFFTDGKRPGDLARELDNLGEDIKKYKLIELNGNIGYLSHFTDVLVKRNLSFIVKNGR